MGVRWNVHYSLTEGETNAVHRHQQTKIALHALYFEYVMGFPP